MLILIVTLTLFQLFFSLKKPLWGFAFLLLVKILIPDCARSLVPLLSLNSQNSILLFLVFIVKKENYREELKNPLVKYIIIFISFLIIIFFVSGVVPKLFQLKYLMNFLVLQILPIIVGICVIKDINSLFLVLKCFLIGVTICVSYGLICYIFNWDYAYSKWFVDAFGTINADVNNAADIDMGNVIGRIVGTSTPDTWRYGMFITPVFMIITCLYCKLKNNLLLVLSLLCALTILFTTRRAPIISAIVFICILFVRNFSIKKIFWGVCIIFIAIISIYYIPQLSNYNYIIKSSLYFWDDSIAYKNNVSGSSFSLRLYQLQYTISSISEHILFGNGWGYMYVKYHPMMYGWESIIFTTLVQIGFCGFLMMLILYYRFYKYSIQFSSNNVYSVAFFVGNIFYMILNDTVYPFYTFLGAILLNKINRFIEDKSFLQVRKQH